MCCARIDLGRAVVVRARSAFGRALRRSWDALDARRARCGGRWGLAHARRTSGDGRIAFRRAAHLVRCASAHAGAYPVFCTRGGVGLTRAPPSNAVDDASIRGARVTCGVRRAGIAAGSASRGGAVPRAGVATFTSAAWRGREIPDVGDLTARAEKTDSRGPEEPV